MLEARATNQGARLSESLIRLRVSDDRISSNRTRDDEEHSNVVR